MAVIGDGAITGGMAFEAMNCAGYLGVRHMVILNDNGQVILIGSVDNESGETRNSFRDRSRPNTSRGR